MENREQWLVNFGLRLRAERERQGFTRLVLAELAHTEQGYIVQIERGERSPSLRTFLNLITALCVSADSIIFGAHDDDSIERERVLSDFTKFIAGGRQQKESALRGKWRCCVGCTAALVYPSGNGGSRI